MIRPQVERRLNKLLRQQCANDYRSGWVWFKLQEAFEIFTRAELQLIAESLEYKQKWAWHKFEECGVEDSFFSQQPPKTQPSALTHFDQALQLLGLKRPFDKAQLKSAYRQKALETHPDVGGTHDAFLAVKAAFDLLEAEVAA